VTNSSVKQVLYCTALPQECLPEYLKLGFRDLDEFCRDLLRSAVERVTLVSPFWSPKGVELLSPSLAIAAQRGALVRVVVDARTSDTDLRAAINCVSTETDGDVVLRRMRILKGTESFAFIHTKLILIDGARGYIGSANLTAGGLERNFELGVELVPAQVGMLEQLIAVFEAKGMLRDNTQQILSC
jgi:phosphatidylserine/phosphatidylglycerophosphate/cardiolipin synthase-like enzyme